MSGYSIKIPFDFPPGEKLSGMIFYVKSGDPGLVWDKRIVVNFDALAFTSGNPGELAGCDAGWSGYE